MNTPTAAMVWEFWWRHRRSWMALGSVVPVFLGLQLIVDSGASKPIQMLQVFAALFSVATVVWIFSYAEPDERGRHGGFPFRMYRMPVATWKLVACPIVLGAGVMLGLYLIWAGLFAGGLDLALRPQAMVTQAMTLLAIQASLQAVVWCLYRFPWIRVTVLIVVTCGMALASIAAPDHGYYGLSWAGFNGVLGAAILVSMGAAWLGVERDRRGGWKGWTGRCLQAMADAWPARRRSFASPQLAQFWFEWRRKALFPGFLLGCLMAATIMIFPIPAAINLDPPVKLIAYAGLPLMTLTISFTLGFGLAKKDLWTPDLTLPAYHGVRPISTADLVFAKIQCALVVAVIGWLLFTALAIPAFGTFHWLAAGSMEVPSWQSFRQENQALMAWALHPWTIVIAVALTWKCIVGSLSIGLMGRSRCILRRGVTGVLTVLTIIFLVLWSMESQKFQRFMLQALPTVTVLIVITKLAVAIRSVMQVRWRGLYTKQQTVFFALLWAAFAACILATAHQFQLATRLAPAFVWFCAALLLPAGEFFACALHLQANRHS